MEKALGSKELRFEYLCTNERASASREFTARVPIMYVFHMVWHAHEQFIIISEVCEKLMTILSPALPLESLEMTWSGESGSGRSIGLRRLPQYHRTTARWRCASSCTGDFY
jgi:hypothetical protein